jgi:hypothetical protein
MLADNSAQKLQNKIAFFLSLPTNPYSLWSVRSDKKDMLDASVVSLPMLEKQSADSPKLVLYGSEKLNTNALLCFQIHISLFWKE